MAIAQQYPLNTPKNSDLLVGTSIPAANTNDDPKTSSFSVSSIGSFLITENNIITGGGTFNTIPLWTPDGTKLGDSIITQSDIGIDVISIGGRLSVSGDLTVNGRASFSGQYARFSGQIQDFNTSSGTAGQILSSTGNNVQWVDAVQTTEITITDAQLRTLGTTRVEILPEPGSGYAYQILGLTTQALSSGSSGEFYDWGTQDAIFSWRGSAPFASEHRVIIPNGQLPVGGGAGASGMYVGTPIAGGSRDDAAIKLGVTSDINPIITPGEDPNANWRINVTYRLIKGS